MAAWVLVCLALVGTTVAIRLPGVTPVEYVKGQVLPIKVNSITSVKTAIPFDYYSLMFCGMEKKDGTIDTRSQKTRPEVENFGEILWGDSIKPSRYEARALSDVTCQKVCTTKVRETGKKWSKQHGLVKLATRINEEYRGHLLMDSLPVSEVFIWENRRQNLYYKLGYPLGVPGNKTHPPLVNNHLAFTIKYHKPDEIDLTMSTDGIRIVGFNVVPYSISSSNIDSDCQGAATSWSIDSGIYPPQQVVAPLKDGSHGTLTQKISWSYSVRWVEDPEVAWTSRWDHYLQSADSSSAKIHWFSIVNSLLIVLFLSGMVAMIMLRALHKDFNRYNDPDNEDEAQEETGWKLVHADVFRTPEYYSFLAVNVGTGCQLLGMSFVTIIFALFGFLNPANRGGLLTAMLLLFVLMGSFGGYTTARLAKMFHAQSWKTIFGTGMYFPGLVFTVWFTLNLILWAKHASNAVPFQTMFAIIGLWLCVCVPLVFVGAVFGYKTETIEAPLAVNPVARLIPEQRWYLQPWVTILVSGIIPFGAAFIELYFILSSLWLNKFYYVFGFMAVVFVILTITCAEISIVMTYFQLCYEDHRWWWRAFATSASSGLHLFLYSIFYFKTTLKLRSFWSMCLYFGWMSVISYFFAVMTGTIGFLSTLVFVRKIYAALKVD